MKKNNGVTIIILAIIIAILIAVAGVAVYFVVGDDGVISKTIKMDVETTQGEVRDHLLSLINVELRSASSDIVGTTDDISTRFNEPKLINFLQGNHNYSDTDHDETEVIKCIEEFSDSKTIIPKAGGDSGIEIKDKYRIIVDDLCTESDKYGTGKTIENGNIFTLEAITEKEINEEGVETGNILSTGNFELKYYDKDGKSEVLEKVSLYLTNQS